MADLNLAGLNPEPAGFGDCRDCGYRELGSSVVCFACASAGIERIGHDHCITCDQRLRPAGVCSNYWCRQAVETRYFDFIYAIAMRSGPLQTAINRYKFGGATGWATIFGRVLVGYLDENPNRAGGWDEMRNRQDLWMGT
jgi:predicted amidophosphoribosyltransferase